MRSPASTRIRAPTSTRSTGAALSAPAASSSRAVSGAISSKRAMARRARPTLQDSSTRLKAKRKLTAAASKSAPRATAPRTAIVMSRFMSGRSRASDRQARGSTKSSPASTAPP